MRTFSYSDVIEHRASQRYCTLLSQLSEYKGRFEAVKLAYPDLLDSLAREAFIDDVHASAKIEGISLDRARVAEILSGEKATTPAERQIAGYAAAQREIDGDPFIIDIAAASIVKLHALLLPDANFGGRSRYRKLDYLRMAVEGRTESVRVSPINAFETPLYLGSACDSLAEAMAEESCCRLLLIPHFTVDMLCIRPFDEGNGRLARLFARLLMLRMGLDICRFISIEALCDHDAAFYYQALNECTAGWDRNAGDYDPFVTYWLAIIKQAYEALFAKTAFSTGGAPSKPERVRLFFERHPGSHTKRDVAEALPDISLSTIENALHDLTTHGVLRRTGAGRSTSYELV